MRWDAVPIDYAVWLLSGRLHIDIMKVQQSYATIGDLLQRSMQVTHMTF